MKQMFYFNIIQVERWNMIGRILRHPDELLRIEIEKRISGKET